MMARSPGESKIPVFHTNPLKSKISKPLSSLSSRVRAHLDASKSRASSSVIFGILSAGGGGVKNVTGGRSLSGGPVSSSHDDLKTQTASRPTNIFLASRFFPAIVKKTETTVNADYVGKRVRLGSGKEGVLRFHGQTQFGEGVWCGVELDCEDGSTDGSVNNVSYFSCPTDKGVFALAEDVEPVAEVREYLSDVSDSGPHSLLGITADLEHIQHDNERPCTSDAGCLRKENPFRYSSGHLHQSSQMSTPTPNSSNGSYVPPGEWKCGSQHSSSAGSLALSHRGLGLGVDTLSASLHMSKHSSFECDESLGILTPDQMGELTTCSDGCALGGGSCDDFSALAFPDTNTESSKTDLVDIQIEYPSLDNIMDVPSAVENSEECYPPLSQPPHTEPVERLYSETDTCMMSVSSISDHVEPIKERKFDIAQRTPSLEELPVDDLSATLVAPEQPVDAPAPAPSTTSFVTSVTSIGSWDNGYQGDGECSRPTSRGADASPLARVPKMVSKALDPMTDSDFYTESDADLYEDATCQRGDRKARVIDGKLFGSPGNTKMVSSQSYATKVIASEQSDAPRSEEMDSSGIYSDLEKKLDAAERTVIEVVLQTPVLLEEIHSDASANSSSKSVSSQKLVVCEVKPNPNQVPSDIKDAKPTPKSKPTKPPSKSAPAHVKPENSLKRRNDRGVSLVKKDNLVSGESSSAKPKMPRRNVTSKVKTMISGSSKGSEDENQENHQPHPNKNHAKKANGKWDSVISKIEKSRTQEKCKTEKLKDVKSKVVCGMPRVNQSKLHKDVKIFSPNGNAINKVTLPSKTSAATLSGSTSSLKDVPSGHRVKTRKTRTRLGIESPSQSTSTALASISQASSRNSSVTDISDSHVDISQHSLPAVVLATEYPRGKKTSSLLCSPLSEGAVPCVPLPLPSSQTNGNVKISTLPRTKTNLKPAIGSVNSLIESSSTSAMKVPKKNIHRRTLPKVVPLRDQNRLANGGGAGACSTNKTTLKPLAAEHGRHDGFKNGKTKSKATAVQIPKVNPLLAQLKYTADGMEAFIILFQRLTADMDVFTLPYIKRELTKYKSDWLDMKLKLEEANVSCKRLKEEIETQQTLHEHKIEELHQKHAEQLNVLHTRHEEESEKQSESYEKQLKEMKEKLKTREAMLEQKFNDDLKRIQHDAESKLESILEETKRQVEMLRCENETWKQKLRDQSNRNLKDSENKVKLRIEQIESKYERRLNEAAEELRKKEEQFVAFSNKRAENLLKRKLANLNEQNGFDAKSNPEHGVPHGFKMEVQNLEEEVCSLRTVLELKHSEIQDLRKLNEKLHGDVQDLPFIMQKLDSAQARVEDLNAQLQTKTEVEKHLLKENRKLTDIVHAETEKRKRLTFQNEELLWKLKRSSQVAKTLAVFNSSQSKEHSVSESEVSCHSTPINTNRLCRQQLNFSRSGREKHLKRSRTDDDMKATTESPTEADVSSKVLGVVEKSDSVSWVLEIDESPIEVASRMLRRANSLRGVPSKKKSSHRQPLTLPTRAKKHDDEEPSKVDFGVQCCDIDSTLDQSNTSGNSILRSSVENGDTPVKVIDEPVEPIKKDEEDNIILDISSIFDFLQDSDFDTDTPLTSEENNVVGFFPTDKAIRLPFSTSSSSNSSLDLEVYGKDGHFQWISDQNATDSKGVPGSAPSDSMSSSTSHSVSDIDDSESTDGSSSSYVDGDGKEKMTKG